MLPLLRHPGLLIVLLVLTATLPSVGQTGSSSSRHSRTVTHVSPPPDSGALADSVYHNRTFAFSYKVPFGWVDRTSEMRPENGDAGGSTGEDARTSTSSSKSLLLLSVFERPPQAAGDTVNSSVLIAAESVSTYPGLKDASQYFGPLTEVTSSKGFKVVNEPYDVDIRGGRLVRADFRKELGKVTMFQSTVAMIEKGYVVSFTFIGASEDEVEDLIENLQFGRRHAR